MKVPLGAFALLAVLLTRDSAAAEHVELDASLGFGIPAGALERGSRLSDTTFGMVPFEVGGAWFVVRHVALRAAASYGVGIPKLCASAGDCGASLGHDVAVDLGARVAPFELAAIAPRIDAGIGWEWYSTSLSDKGVVSARSYSGPTFLALTLSVPIRVSSRLAIGPALGLRAGVFTSSARTTPGWTESSLDGTVIHAWLRASVDARFTF